MRPISRSNNAFASCKSLVSNPSVEPIADIGQQVPGVGFLSLLLPQLASRSIGQTGREAWGADLYDPNLRTEPLRNISEDETYDARFPDHPLSRVRRLIRHTTLIVVPEVKAAAPF